MKKIYWSLNNREISNNRNLILFFQHNPFLKYNPLSFGIILSLALTGIIASWNKNRQAKMMAGVIIANTIIIALFFFNARFRLPLLPFLIILSAHGIDVLNRSIRNKSAKAILYPAILIITLLFTYIPVITQPGKKPVQHLMSAGFYHYSQAQYHSALDNFKQALEVDSTFPEVNMQIGLCFLQQQNPDSTLHYLKREIRFHPDSYKPYIDLASAFYINKEYDSAIIHINKAYTLAPFDPSSNILKLRIESDMHPADTLRIKKAVFEGMNNAGDNLWFLTDAGIILSNIGAFDEARELLNRAISLPLPSIENDADAFSAKFYHTPEIWSREKGRAFYQLGYISGLAGSYSESITFSKNAIHANPDIQDAYINLISGYISLDQFEQADSVYNRALLLFPQNEYLKKFKK